MTKLKKYHIHLLADVVVAIQAEDLDNALAAAKRRVEADLHAHKTGGFSLENYECLDERGETDEAD